jgi:hypothetical protein
VNGDLAVQLAAELRTLGVSHAGVVDLLTNYSLEVIERQLRYLPLRKAKRKSAFIVQAIRHDYSPPNELYHATPPAHPSQSDSLDENTEQPL